MATFSEIASALKGEILGFKSDFNVPLVTCESKNAEGALFFAVKGTKTDGHDFLSDAIAQGAIGIVASKILDSLPVPAILVNDTRDALSQASDITCGSPSKKLFVVGITGTNGKTTTNWMVTHALNSMNFPAFRMGTLGVAFPGGRASPGSLTTPDSVSLQKTLKEGLEGGARAAVLEVSSHALSQKRVHHVAFDVGVFMNLTHDHLDYHSSMEEYFEAKAELFSLLKDSNKESSACINLDDPYGEKIEKILDKRLRCITFGENDRSSARISNVKLSLSGATFEIHFEGKIYRISSEMLGAYNVSNLTAAFCACISGGFDPELVASALSSVPDVPGRLERISRNGITAFVDYAHTPDALERALLALRPFASERLWVVFGCGGDRDRSKRPQMAKVASSIADKVVVTSDNPRTESPEEIIREILSGGINPTFTEPDRREAIRETVRNAKAGDIVLVAGKGHEDYQILKTGKIHFSDREEISKAFDTMATVHGV